MLAEVKHVYRYAGRQCSSLELTVTRMAANGVDEVTYTMNTCVIDTQLRTTALQYVPSYYVLAHSDGAACAACYDSTTLSGSRRKRGMTTALLSESCSVAALTSASEPARVMTEDRKQAGRQGIAVVTRCAGPPAEEAFLIAKVAGKRRIEIS